MRNGIVRAIDIVIILQEPNTDMNDKRLFTFGCSFTQYIWPTWADLIGQKFAFYENWGKGAAGNLYIFNAIVECIKTNQLKLDDTVIIMWSSVNREDRYINNKWQCSGNIHVSNMFGSEFTKKFVDEKGNLIRDLAFVSAAHKILEKHGIEHYFLSAFDLTNDYLHKDIKGIEKVVKLYQSDLDLINPSVKKIIFNDFVDYNYRRPRPNQSIATMNEGLYNIFAGPDWPDYATYLTKKFNNLKQVIVDEILQKEQDIKEDWHPSPLEHLEYLQKIFGVDVVGEQTIQFAQETTESVFGQKTIKFNQHLAKRL